MTDTFNGNANAFVTIFLKPLKTSYRKSCISLQGMQSEQSSYRKVKDIDVKM